MSVDQADFASVTQQAQAGSLQSFWPIVIPSVGKQLRTEYEININPCDALWMPSVFDLSYSRNPGQLPSEVKTADWNCSPFPGSAAPISGNQLVPDVGYNISDVYNAVSPNVGQLVQAAPIFSLRFNTPNNPYILFGLSTCLGRPHLGVVENPPSTGGCMRSVTGPISRLWIKFYEWGFSSDGFSNNSNGENTIVLLSSLGFAQVTMETTTNGVATGVQNLSSGGYNTPQLNSANKKYLGMV